MQKDLVIIDCQKQTKSEIIKSIPKILKKNQKLKLINCQDPELKKIAKAVNYQDLKKRYQYIYDEVCQFLDEQFDKHNYCQFKNDLCISAQKKHSHYREYGCCYIRPVKKWYHFSKRELKEGKCEYLDGHQCQTKSIACKLFTCYYLQEQNIRFSPDDIILLKYFFNKKQKKIIETSFYTSKEDMIEKLLKNK